MNKNVAWKDLTPIFYLAERPSRTAGKVYSGMKSPDGTKLWRLDYDGTKGFHVNWERVEDGVKYHGYFKVPGKTQGDYLDLILHRFPKK
jgi:hypothetical protein